MPNMMKAAVYYGPRDIRIEQVPRPTLSEGEVLIKVLRSGICGTDAGEWVSGPKVFPVAHPHPHSSHHGPLIPGHEFVGEIVEARSSAFAAGQRVVTGAGISCGSCDQCLTGRTNMCRSYRTLGLNMNGGMAQFVAVPETIVAAVPDRLSTDAAGLAQPLAVGIHAARRAGVRDGDKVVIIGAGAIGSFVLAGLKHLHKADIAVVDFAGPKLERSARLGAQFCLEPSENLQETIIGVLGRRPDVVIEASGAQGQLAMATGLVRDGGRVLAVGIPKALAELDMHSMIFREVTLETTLAHVFSLDIPAALEILDRTPLAVELLQDPFPLDRLGEALDLLSTGKVDGKLLIDPQL